MAEPTYEDYKRNVSIHEVLKDAGYHLNRRDGLRYPSYVRTDSDGRRVRGDKFIVTRNGMCCFQPPEHKNYNIISFIKEHPHLFIEYTPGMSKDRLVNLVCRRLMNMPEEIRNDRILEPRKESKPFNINEYERQWFYKDDSWSRKQFYPYFKNRGINLETMDVFAHYFCLATKERSDEKKYTNLSFPLSRADKPDSIVGLEERSRPNAEGKTAYKGMALGSDATNGMWIAKLDAESLEGVYDVYWFESAFDAMAYYQLHCKEHDFSQSAFISTGGNPSQRQFKGVLDKTEKSVSHHLCFDNDRAGKMFAVNFLLTSDGRTYTTHLSKEGELVVNDTKDGIASRRTIDIDNFDIRQAAEILGIDMGEQAYPQEMKAYVKSLRDRSDIFSGDTDLLTPELTELYSRYESLAEEYQSELHSGLVCKEDLEVSKGKATTAMNEYESRMKSTLSKLHENTCSPFIVREVPEQGYKDWNDQLLGTHMNVEEVRTENEHEQRSGFRR